MIAIPHRPNKEGILSNRKNQRGEYLIDQTKKGTLSNRKNQRGKYLTGHAQIRTTVLTLHRENN